MRAALAALLVGGLAAAVMAVYAGGGASADAPAEELAIATVAPLPQPSASASASDQTSEPPPPAGVTSSPSAGPSPSLEELRASDAFVEFAEARRARSAPGADLAYQSFGWDGGDGNVYRFLESSTLWNVATAPVRDDLLRYGQEWRQPLFSSEKPSSPYIARYARSGADSQLLAFITPVLAADGRPVLRIHAVLLDVEVEPPTKGTASILGSMPPFSIQADGYESWSDAAANGFRPKIMQWAAGTGKHP